ncbi:MAG TPA: hypothetical protein VN380_21080 [Thermoanaerobaculia bacterium]|nr:hypothetical protein [Thermoanaerobaculia bacterium]
MTSSGSKTPGTIITFYSYKGGTGRSMALANVGWILAASGKRVLMIDWDLEAPGLHRYFRPFLIDPDLTASDGIIDFVLQYATAAVKPASERPPDWLERTTDVSKYTLSIDYDFQGDGVLDLIPAGRQRDTYATRVSTFNWQNFYERLGGELFVNALRDALRRDYDYVLIDSRTGVSDTAGICTVHFPDLLAVCFTYNNQSTEGASGVAQSVNRQRAIEQHDPRFRIVPLPMRIDPFESAKLDTRRAYAWSLFAPLLGWMSEAERRGYWVAVEVPYFAAFAYEELLSTFRDEPSDPKSVLAAFVRMTGYLTNGAVTTFRLLVEPSEREAVLAAFAATSSVTAAAAASTASTETAGEAAIRRAERVYGNLTPVQQESARRFWLRLVRLTGDEEAGFLGRVRALGSDLGDVDSEVIAAFVNAGVVTLGSEGASSEPRYEAVDDALADWARLRGWATEQRDFLMWRQRLRPLIDDWLRFNRSSTFLMPEWRIEASARFAKNVEDLNAVEQDYINASRRSARKRRTQLIIAAAAIVVLIVAGIWYQQYRQRQEVVDANRAAVRRMVDAAASSTDSLEAALLLAELGNYSDPAAPDLMNTIQRLAQRVVPRTLIKTGGGTVIDAEFSPSSRQILTVTADRTIVVWNAETGQRVSVVQGIPDAASGEPRQLDDGSQSIAFPRENVIIAGLRNGFLRRWSLSDGGVAPPTILRSATSDASAAMVFYAPKGDRLVDVGENHMAIRDPLSGKVSSYVRARIGPTRRCAITSDGSAAVVANGPRIALWDTRSGVKIASDDTRQSTTDVAVTIPSLRIVSSSETSIRVMTIAGTHSGVIEIGAPEGTTGVDATNYMVGTGAQDGVGRLRSFADFSNPTELRGHRGRISFVTFDADGKLFATCGVDGTVRIWPVVLPKTVPHQWKDIAPFFRDRTTACLTAEERAQILGEKLGDATAKYRKCEMQHGRTAF